MEVTDGPAAEGMVGNAGIAGSSLALCSARPCAVLAVIRLHRVYMFMFAAPLAGTNAGGPQTSSHSHAVVVCSSHSQFEVSIWC